MALVQLIIVETTTAKLSSIKIISSPHLNHFIAPTLNLSAAKSEPIKSSQGFHFGFISNVARVIEINDFSQSLVRPIKYP